MRERRLLARLPAAKDVGHPVVRVTSGQCKDVWLSDGVRTVAVQFRLTRLCMGRWCHILSGGTPHVGTSRWCSGLLVGMSLLNDKVSMSIAHYLVRHSLGKHHLRHGVRTDPDSVENPNHHRTTQCKTHRYSKHLLQTALHIDVSMDEATTSPSQLMAQMPNSIKFFERKEQLRERSEEKCWSCKANCDGV